MRLHPCFSCFLLAEADMIGKEQKQNDKTEQQDQIKIRWDPFKSHGKLLPHRRIKQEGCEKIVERGGAL